MLSQKIDCPLDDELAQFTLGNLDEHASDAIAAHLEMCESCQKRLESLEQSDDSLLQQLRKAPSRDPFAHEPQRRQIVDDATVTLQNKHSPAKQSVPAAPQMPQIDQYRLIAKLGEGGMGAVYKAQHVKLEKFVALKVLPNHLLDNPQAVLRFEREMRAVGKLEHENIVRATDAGEAGGVHFLAMELVNGVDLSALSKLVGPFPIADACELVRQTCLGLQFAHENGIVHRDIKPSNLMLTETGLVKILDMGLALLEEKHLATSSDLTGSGQVMGTLDYMAPEQCNDSHDVDARADIYSLGATVYKLLCGESPFSAPQYSTMLKKIMAIANDEPPPIHEKRSDLPAELTAVIAKMMAKHPENRFPTMAAVGDALAPYCEGNRLATYFKDGLIQQWLTRNESATSVLTTPLASSPLSNTAPTVTHRPSPATAPRRKKLSRLLVASAVLIVAIVLGIVIYIATDNGQLIIQSEVDNVHIVVKRGDEVVEGFHVSTAGKGTKLRTGRYTVELHGANADELQIEPEQVTLTRGHEKVVRITRRPRKAAPSDRPDNASQSPASATVSAPDQTWFKPVNLGQPVNSARFETSPQLLDDGLSLLFIAFRTDGLGGADIWICRRETLTGPWSKPVSFGAPINSKWSENRVSLSADGRTLAFASSDRPGGPGEGDLWISTRRSKNSGWPEPQLLPVNTAGFEDNPCVIADGLTLLFSGGRPGSYGAFDLWQSKRDTFEGPWSEPTNLGPKINGPSNEYAPHVSADGLALVVASDRDGGQGGSDLWMSTRTSPDGSWTDVVNLGPNVNSDSDEHNPWLSPDRKLLLFTSNRPGGHGAYDIWMSRRLR